MTTPQPLLAGGPLARPQLSMINATPPPLPPPPPVKVKMAPTSAAARAVAAYAQRREARLADQNAPTDLRAARLARDHKDFRATITELEAENAALRAALDRERAENHKSAELRYAAEEDGRHRAALHARA